MSDEPFRDSSASTSSRGFSPPRRTGTTPSATTSTSAACTTGCCTRPGIVYGYAGDLRVTARARGDLSVEVQPGYAIDGMGNDLMIFDATIRNINLEEFRLPQTIYIVLRYYEELTDFIAYKENLEYKGHRRVLESLPVELSQTEPDIAREVELARDLPREGRQPRPRRARPGGPERRTRSTCATRQRGGLCGSMLPPARCACGSRRCSSRSGAARIEYTRRGVIAGARRRPGAATRR